MSKSFAVIDQAYPIRRNSIEAAFPKNTQNFRGLMHFLQCRELCQVQLNHCVTIRLRHDVSHAIKL